MVHICHHFLEETPLFIRPLPPEECQPLETRWRCPILLASAARPWPSHMAQHCGCAPQPDYLAPIFAHVEGMTDRLVSNNTIRQASHAWGRTGDVPSAGSRASIPRRREKTVL